MNKRSFDDNIVIAILAGGIGIMLYDVFQLWFGFWFAHTVSIDDFNKEIPPKALAGIAVMLFALFYALIARFLRKRQNNTSFQDSTKDKNEKSSDDKPNLEQKKGSSTNGNSHGNKQLVILDVIIFTIFGFGLFFAGYLYFHDDSILYNFSETTYNDTEGKIPNFYMSYNFTTTSFSAQNNITVSIMAKLSDDLVNNRPISANNIKNIFVYFPTATPRYLYYKEGHLESYPITLYRSTTDGRFFTGSDIIKYQSEGDKCTFVTTTTVNQLNGDCQNKIHTLFHISSSDSYFQYKNNKTTLALTWVLIAFTVVTVRDFLKNMFQNISLFNNKKRDNREQQKKDRPKR